MVLSIILTIVILVANWMVFKKMGREGWEGIIPVYNQYVLFDVLYGNGWKFLLLLIPIYNIYVMIKMDMDLAQEFGQSKGFGVGLFFLPFIFLLVLGFGKAQFRGGSVANEKEDFVTKAADAVADKVAPKKTCPACGAEVDANVDFCPTCGAKFEAKAEE